MQPESKKGRGSISNHTGRYQSETYEIVDDGWGNIEDLLVSVLIAPVIPVLNDEELEKILKEVRVAGALDAGYVLLRLPLELKDLFEEWLQCHEPLKAKHVMQRIFDSRGGKAYDSTFGQRMTGTGLYANMLNQRFQLAMKKLSFPGLAPFNSMLFRPPMQGGQMDLFW
jgi:DNA repair photolyase